MKRKVASVIVAVVVLMALGAGLACAADPLPSWNDGSVKKTIVEFVKKVTRKGSADYVPPAERIATFDNDGTLWLEKPLYIQLQHGLHAIGQLAAEKPEVRDRQPFKAVYEKDMAWLGKVAADYARGDLSGVMTLGSGITEVFAGMTLEAFEADVLDFLNNAQDARFKKPYKLLTYQPMVELVHTLQGNGFQVYITTGGGRDFVRAVCEEIYNIPRSMTIGSSVSFQYGEDAQGVAQVMRTKELEQPIDDGPGKPVHIHRAIGRRPVMAAGNSDGDIHMLKYATGHTGLTLGLLVHHDDPEREYAYGPASGLPDTKVGTFSQALYDAIAAAGANAAAVAAASALCAVCKLICACCNSSFDTAPLAITAWVIWYVWVPPSDNPAIARFSLSASVRKLASMAGIRSLTITDPNPSQNEVMPPGPPAPGRCCCPCPWG